MITTPAELRAKFAEIATDLGCSFAYGNSDQILNRQTSSIQYPILWLEIPDIKLIRMGGLHRAYGISLLCLSDKAVNDLDGEANALDAMYLLTEQVLQRLQLDASATPAPFIFDMDGVVSEYKGAWSADDDWGWRTNIEIIGAACESADCC